MRKSQRLAILQVLVSVPLGSSRSAFIKFLTAPAAAPVIRAKGMEPG
jgi:hypothetical protein